MNDRTLRTKQRLYGCNDCLEYEMGRCGRADPCKYAAIFRGYGNYARYVVATEENFLKALKAATTRKIIAGALPKLVVVDLDTGKTYRTVTEAAEATGISGSYLSAHLHGRYPTAKGKRFAYQAV